MKRQSELVELIGHLCNNTIDGPQKERLEFLLDGNVEAQQVYRQYMALHAELSWLQTDPFPLESELASLPVQDGSANLLKKMVWPLAIAASLLMGVGLGFYGQALNNNTSSLIDNANRVKHDRVVAPVASITGSRNSRWSTKGDTANIGYSSGLYAGQAIRLIEGLAEVTFGNGARVILEAPAELVVRADDTLTLREGRLTASVPDGSEGFQIRLKGLTLTDRGSEFGVVTDKSGNAELHVFDGVLEGRFKNKDGVDDRTVLWTSDKAVRIDPLNQRIRDLEQTDVRFVRTLAPPFGPSNGLLVKEDFDYPSAPLSAQNGGFGWGGPWQDINTDGNSARINRVSDGSLKYIGLSNSGNSAALEGNFNRIRRVLSTSFGGVFETAGLIETQDGARLVGKDNTVVYLSFSQQVSKTDEVYYGFELHRGDGNKNRVLCVGHGAAKKWTVGPPRQPIKEAGVTGWAVTSEFNGKENHLKFLGDLGPETTDTVFFVAKISFGENNEDTIEVYKNPKSLIDESQCEPLVVGRGNFSFDRVSLANFEGNKTYRIDHIRFGTNFSAVTRHQWDANALAKVVEKISSNQ